MTPIVVDKKKKRTELALSAMNVFSEKGFTGISMNEMAALLGVGKGTLYEYFDSKDELISAALTTWADLNSGGIDQFETELDITDPVERLKAYFDLTLTVYLEDDKTIKLMIALMHLWAQNPEFMSESNLIPKMFGGMRHFIVKALEDGVKAGVFNKAISNKAEQMAINIVAYLDGLFFHHYLSPGYFDIREQVRLYLEQLLAELHS